MKKIFYLILALPVLAVSCVKQNEVVPGTLKGIFYANIPGEKQMVELVPEGSRTYNLLACAQGENVADAVMNFTFKADPDLVGTFNAANHTKYQMCPGSAFEFLVNDVMMPRYGKSSTSAKVRVTASGLEDGIEYILPLTIESGVGSPNWAVADTIAAYVLLKKSDYDPNGPGTQNNPYPVASVDDLKGIGDKMIEGTTVYFRLENDLDMTGVTDWMPVNDLEPYKKFDFDGGGHTISNFTSNKSLFGAVVGKCHDLTVANASITNDGSLPCGIIGAYAGAAGQPADVYNVHVQGKVTNTKANGTGGLFGIIVETTINACSAQVVLVATGKYDVGGIYGYDNTTSADKKSVVSNCWTSGDICGNRFVGGIAGMISNYAGPDDAAIKGNETSILNCYSTAKVHSSFKYGGIAGDGMAGLKDNKTSFKFHIERCIAWNEALYSDVTDTGVHYSAGAVVGFSSSKNYHVDCYRKADLVFSDCPGNTTNQLFDQANSSPESPLVQIAESPGSTNYNYPYHGKAAPKGATVSDVARSLGWDEGIWDLSGDFPFFKGGDAPVQDVGSGGQLPDFDENEFYK